MTTATRTGQEVLQVRELTKSFYGVAANDKESSAFVAAKCMVFLARTGQGNQLSALFLPGSIGQIPERCGSMADWFSSGHLLTRLSMGSEWCTSTSGWYLVSPLPKIWFWG